LERFVKAEMQDGKPDWTKQEHDYIMQEHLRAPFLADDQPEENSGPWNW
jgi:hypothetical protein